ncbi:hypothetical protein IEQ34_006314 [Dendrobium chrysotoxum]|uniref:Uncharacterized protein n=1 Tax=Dendrobium chrysotoxum TaxID=161865 RepID=A0AAV7HBB9_DENCH|nr:hypothetical protein IEQ34_006314 [Dendrobium chrysotoxum]
MREGVIQLMMGYNVDLTASDKFVPKYIGGRSRPIKIPQQSIFIDLKSIAYLILKYDILSFMTFPRIKDPGFLNGYTSSLSFKAALASAFHSSVSFLILKFLLTVTCLPYEFQMRKNKALAAPFEFALVGKFPSHRPSIDAIRKFFFNLKLNCDCSVIVLNPKNVLIKLFNDLDYCRPSTVVGDNVLLRCGEVGGSVKLPLVVNGSSEPVALAPVGPMVSDVGVITSGILVTVMMASCTPLGWPGLVLVTLVVVAHSILVALMDFEYLELLEAGIEVASECGCSIEEEGVAVRELGHGRSQSGLMREYDCLIDEE